MGGFHGPVLSSRDLLLIDGLPVQIYTNHAVHSVLVAGRGAAVAGRSAAVPDLGAIAPRSATVASRKALRSAAMVSALLDVRFNLRLLRLSCCCPSFSARVSIGCVCALCNASSVPVLLLLPIELRIMLVHGIFVGTHGTGEAVRSLLHLLVPLELFLPDLLDVGPVALVV